MSEQAANAEAERVPVPERRADTTQRVEGSSNEPDNTDMSGSQPPSRDEIDAKIQLSEARTDTKFERVLGEMRTGFAQLNGRFDAMTGHINGRFETLEARLTGVERTTSGLKATIIGTGIGVVVVVIAALGYGQQLFNNGFGARDIALAVVAEYATQHPAPPAPVTPPSN